MASSSCRQTPAGSSLPPEQAVALATGPRRSQRQPQVEEACLKPGHEKAIGNNPCYLHVARLDVLLAAGLVHVIDVCECVVLAELAHPCQ